MIVIQAFLIIADGDELQADIVVARNMTIHQKSMAKRKRRFERAREALGGGDVIAVFGPMDEASWEARRMARRRRAVRYGDKGSGTEVLSPSAIFRQLGVSSLRRDTEEAKKRKKAKKRGGQDGEGPEGVRGGEKSEKLKLPPLARPAYADVGGGDNKTSERKASAGWIGADFAHGEKLLACHRSSIFTRTCV
mmetsp:Transcript_43368/g.117511  ORF Transcript_43368/g.117511 Transcript_43368/m.117511 type:complete len:193 (-) Transcript_43368:2645-3223(-)